jgi:hypothetical protein
VVVDQLGEVGLRAPHLVHVPLPELVALVFEGLFELEAEDVRRDAVVLVERGVVEPAEAVQEALVQRPPPGAAGVGDVGQPGVVAEVAEVGA